MMEVKGLCNNPNCGANHGESCIMGSRLDKCENWVNSETSTNKKNVKTQQSSTRVPWSGSALGLADLFNISLRKTPTIIGVLGSQDAGKTTLLLGAYLQILKGQSSVSEKFSGSYTLAAWENLAAWVRAEDAARIPSFPPHTPRGISRVPGLLHIALRNPATGVHDVLLTDAPGEWFKQWAVTELDNVAEGARWVIENSTIFLVVADCAKLANKEERGTARRELRGLLERLNNHAGNREVILVWAKSDYQPTEEIKASIRETLRKIPLTYELKTTTDKPETLLDVINYAIEKTESEYFVSPIKVPSIKHSVFESYRGHHDNA